MDDGLRNLERRWRASGSIDDEARWLAGRVRTGRLSLKSLELAACCEHAAAQRVLAGMGVSLSPTTWVTDAARWGEDVCLRAARFAAERAQPVWSSAFPSDTRPAHALRLVDAWLEREATDPPRAEPDDAELDAVQAAELAQLELAEAAEFAGSSVARLAEDASVSAYFALRCLQAVARESRGVLRVPSRWLRRRPARRALSSNPPSVIDDFLASERRAARARQEATGVTRQSINARVAAWALRSPL